MRHSSCTLRCPCTVGILAGVASTAGYVTLSPALERCCAISDTCGVGNLHGVPGMLGGLASALLSWMFAAENKHLVVYGALQPLVQVEGLGITLLAATAGGLLAGCVVAKVDLAKQSLAEDELYEDSIFWHEVEKEE